MHHSSRSDDSLRRTRTSRSVVALLAAAMIALTACGASDQHLGMGVGAQAPVVQALPPATAASGSVGPATIDTFDPTTAAVAAAATATHSQWFGPFVKDLTDPTPSVTFTYHCNDNKSPGGAVLYPFMVREGQSRAYRSTSSKGVTVSADSVATGLDELKLIVTSDHIRGDYQLRIAYECQGDNPDAWYTTGDPAVIDQTPTSATIATPFLTANKAPDPIRYRVQYGPAEGNYNNATAWSDTTLLAVGSTPTTTTVTGLQADTTYHYRVESYQNESGAGTSTQPSFSGPDLTFRTPAAG